MASVINEPVTMVFGNQIAILGIDGWFYCHEKNVKIETIGLISSIKALNCHPLRTKFIVGFTIKHVDYNGADYYENPNNVFLWRDEYRTHIGCLHENTKDFNKKYLELIKKTKQ